MGISYDSKLPLSVGLMHSLKSDMHIMCINAKVVPKPKQRKKNLRANPSDPESRIAAVEALGAARDNPYLPPESKSPDD